VTQLCSLVALVIGHACYALVEIYHRSESDNCNLEYIHDHKSVSKVRAESLELDPSTPLNPHGIGARGTREVSGRSWC